MKELAVSVLLYSFTQEDTQVSVTVSMHKDSRAIRLCDIDFLFNTEPHDI